MKKITKNQLGVLNVIVNFYKKFSRLPSLAEIAAVFGCSRIAIYYRIQWLVKKGYLKNYGGKYLPTEEGTTEIIKFLNESNDGTDDGKN